MRPVRLELEGFTAFRTPTVVDFEGVDLFALTGATGSGKTSVLDGMVFALYGNVPRLADQRTVVPVIAQGMAEARVRLDFTIGAEAFTATRIVRRTKGGGGNTAEARLESGGEVLAGTADEVTAAVTQRLGLSYEHFTKCVVLPQGEFARFLHDKPAARQDLLISLLDLGVYAEMADLAGKQSTRAKADVNVLEARLRDAAHATPEAVAALESRVERFTALVADLDAAAPELAGLAGDAEAIARDVARTAEEAALLGGVRVPSGLGALHDRLATATSALAEAATELAATEAAVTTAEGRLSGLGDRADLVRLLDAHDRGAALQERRVKGEVVVAERRVDVVAATEALTAATASLDAARAGEEEVAAAHRAHAVRADLVVGEECPVCLQTVATIPSGKAPAALSKAKAVQEKAERELRAATDARGAAEKALAIATATLEALDTDLAEISGQLSGAPDRGAIQRALDDHVAAIAAVESGRRAMQEARVRHTVALDARAGCAADEQAARDAYEDARDALAALKPPARKRASVTLLEEWSVLVEWAEREADARQALARELEEKSAAIAAQLHSRIAGLANRCADADLVVPEGGEPIACAREALGRARADHDALAARAAEAESMRVELAAVEAERELAHGLALHLNATHFEKWLLDEAMTALADGATDLLRTLSGDQYSLRVDPKNGSFVVVDHRNADEIRSARTLSGGETFLASLALALALADRIASLAARGAARLESIFLDEGFGTLDPDTLDVVASAIEELGASGRLVGVASHAAELAERLPVRFEVRRSGNASTVERIDR
ncbi:MAG: repair protein SbcC/Rad50 [Acidimicrobiaceae bacterium]